MRYMKAGENMKGAIKWYTVPPSVPRPQSAIDAERAEGLKRKRYQSQLHAKNWGFRRTHGSKSPSHSPDEAEPEDARGDSKT